MKTIGATWKAYLASWPEGQWFDDADETIDGIPGNDLMGEIPDLAEVVFTCGVVYASPKDREGKSLVHHFRRWLKELSTATVVCEVPKDKLKSFAEMLKSISGKLITNP